MLSALAKMHIFNINRFYVNLRIRQVEDFLETSTNSPMRIVAVEAVDEIFVLVVAISTISAVIMMRLLLLTESLHSVIHIARDCSAS